MSIIHYAIEITTEMTEFTNTAFGLTAGIFRWITDRPNYDGNDNPYPLWENNEDNTYIWYEDIILKNSLSNPVRKVDISQTGDYGTLSGFNFSIRNDLLLWKYVRDNNIYFINRLIKLYVVIDNKFYQTWTGVISNNPYDEIDYQFVCIDQFKKVHKTIPPLLIDKNTFPSSSNDSQGKSVPITIGDVTYSKLQTVKNEPDIKELALCNVLPGQLFSIKAVGCCIYESLGVTYPKLTLYTKNKTFVEDEFVGYYLYVTKGGGEVDNDQLIKIISNDATSNDKTIIELETAFDFISDELFRNLYAYDPLKSSYFSNIAATTYDSLYDCHLASTVITGMQVGSWIKFTNIDCTNNGIGANRISLEMSSSHIGKIEIHLNTFDGLLIGEIVYAVNTEAYEWQEGIIDCQLGATESIVLLWTEITGSIQVKNIKMGHNLTNLDTWWFSIMSMDTYHIISDKQIKKIVTDTTGIPLLFIYNENKNQMEQVSNLILNIKMTQVGVTGHPEFVLFSSRLQKDGSVRYLITIVPEQWSVEIPQTSYYSLQNSGYIKLTRMNGEISLVRNTNNNNLEQFPLSNICDRNQNTYVDMYFPDYSAQVGKKGIYTFLVKITFPAKYFDYDFDTLYAAVDLEITSEFSTPKVRIFMDYNAIDSYGDPVYDNDEPDHQVNYPIDEVAVDDSYKANFLPGSYYSNGGTTEDPYTNLWNHTDLDGNSQHTTMRSMLELQDEIFKALKDGTSTNTIQITVNITSNNPDDSAGHFGCVVKLKQAGFVGMKSINPLNDNFYARIKGELFETEETNNVYNTFRLLLETYDGISTNQIDYNNLATARKDWPVGRQLTERKSSFDYLRELCMHSFVCLYPDRTGKRALKAWREDETTIDTITQASIIRDSISSWQNTEISDLYNDFRIWYNYNEAMQNFDSSITVTNIDKTSFPANTDMETYPATLETWKTYVGGISGASYSDAAEMWDVCHNSYLRCAAIQPAPDALSKLYWYNNSNEFLGLPNNGASVNDSAYKFLKNMLEWTTSPKAEVKYSKAISSSNIVLELLDYVSFSDTVFTAAETRNGWITGIEVDINNDRIIYSVMFKPVDEIVDRLIIQRGKLLNTRIFTESGSQPVQVDDGQDRT